MDKVEELVLRETECELELTERDEHVSIAARMAQQCRSSLHIVSRRLDPEVFGSGDFVLAVRDLAVKNRRSNIQIIIFEPRLIVAYGHRLLELTERLSSSIELRKAHQAHAAYNGSMMIADAVGYIHRRNGSRYEGFANFKDYHTAGVHLREFFSMWEVAQPDSELRRMAL